MGKRTPEGVVKKAIMEWLSYQSNCSVFPVATTGLYDPVQKRFRKSAGRPGTPDILVCWNGKFVGIEVKSATGKPTANQVKVGTDIQNCGGTWIVAKCIEDVAAALLKA